VSVREAGNVSDSETTARPSASGHRFGPDLSCTECGITWEAHQKEPVECNPGAHDFDTSGRAAQGDTETPYDTRDKS
jgi:hypothetical protein